MVTRDGMVAVQHYTTNGWAVKVNDTVYTWTPKHNVSLAWVKEADLPKTLAIDTRGCCGGRRKRFHLASLINVNLWETGNRHGTKE